jgi:hypothetical protein
MQAGDIVRIGDGTYTGCVSTTASGTSVAPIVYEAAGTNVVVDGFSVYHSHITIKGFRLMGYVPAYSGAITLYTGGDYCKIFGNRFISSPATVYQVYVHHSSQNVKGALISGNLFRDGAYPAIGLNGGGHLISSNRFENPYGGDVLRIAASNVTIVGNVFTNCSNILMEKGPIKIGASYWFKTVSSDSGMDWSNVGAKKYYRANTGSTFRATGTTPSRWANAVIGVSSNRFLYPVPYNNPPLSVNETYYFEYNTLYSAEQFSNVQQVPTRLTGFANQWKCTNSTPAYWYRSVLGYASNKVLTNGQALLPGETYYFVSNEGDPDFDNVGASSIRQYLVGEAYRFVATQAFPKVWGAGSGILNTEHTDIIQAFQDGSVGASPPDRPARDVLFEGNLIIDCTNCQFGNITDDNTFGNIDRWVFRNNLLVRVSARMNLYAPGFRFFNNTFYRCGLDSGDVINWRVNTRTGISSNLLFMNNILFECGYYEQANSGWYSGAVTNDQYCDYNLVCGSGAGRTKDSAMWTAYGREAHGLNGKEPLFVNPAALDFRLQTNSPAIGAGTNLSAYFTSDYEGNLRGPKWDIGAFSSVESSRKSLSSDTLRPNPPAQVRILP